MKIDILSIFPGMFGSLSESILGRAQDKGLVEIKIHDLRDWTEDKHRTVDDRPFGGGPGMVMMVEPIEKAVAELRMEGKDSRVVLLSAKGERYSQQKAVELSKLEQLILVCGHYEGVDQRVYENVVDEVISIGDYVLTGGELPAMVVTDSVVRLVHGVVGTAESLSEESHNRPGYIEYPHYTRPADYKGWKVPEVLLSGNHAEIEKWREENSEG